MRRVRRRLATARERLARRRLDRASRFLDEHGAKAPLRDDFRLLLAHLSPGQRIEFASHGWFTVRAPSGRRYRIGYGTMANIHVPAGPNCDEHRLCAAPPALQAPAVMLVQKLMLETQEAEFLRIAIKHPPLPRLRPPGRDLF